MGDPLIGEKHIRYLSFIMLALGMLYFYFTFSEFLTEGYALSEETQVLYETLLLKNFAPLFWLFVIGGLIVPLVLVALPQNRTIPGITVAAALAVGGMWSSRQPGRRTAHRRSAQRQWWRHLHVVGAGACSRRRSYRGRPWGSVHAGPRTPRIGD